MANINSEFNADKDEVFEVDDGTYYHPSTKGPPVMSEESKNKDFDEDAANAQKGKRAKNNKKAKKSGSKRRKADVEAEMVDTLKVLQENSRRELKLFERKMSLKQDQECETALKCLEALDALEGIDGPSYAKAITYFHDDHLWRLIFLRMSDKRKKDWVLNI